MQYVHTERDLAYCCLHVVGWHAHVLGWHGNTASSTPPWPCLPVSKWNAEAFVVYTDQAVEASLR